MKAEDHLVVYLAVLVVAALTAVAYVYPFVDNNVALSALTLSAISVAFLII